MKLSDLEKPVRPYLMRETETAELEELVQDAKQRLFQLRVQTRTNALDNPKVFRALKRNIARLKTELRRRAPAAAPAGSTS